MPLYMDVHRKLSGVTADDVAQAHLKDAEVEKKYGVHYHKYWFNKDDGTIFCLVEGPDAETCERVHREAHGLVADDLIEVEPRLVEMMLATPINMDGAAVRNDGGLDTGVRIVLFTAVDNYAEVVSAADQHGVRVMEMHDRIVRDALRAHGGREVIHTGEGIQACFLSVANALKFAEDVLKSCASECATEGQGPRIKIGMAAGEPVENNRALFGVSVAAARRICELAPAGGVLVSGAVRELAVGKGFRFAEQSITQLRGIDEPVAIYRLQQQSEADVRPAAARVRQPPRLAVKARSFWSELKRRRVIPVAAVYSAAVFGMLQIAQLTFDPLGLPPWTYTFLVVLGIFGLPVALVLAWAFDITAADRER